MRLTKEIIRDYLYLINDEKNLGYSDERMKSLLENKNESQAIQKMILEDLYSIEERDGLTFSSPRAWRIWCDIVIRYDFKTGDRVWNGFVKKQFSLVEQNKMVCYMAARGHGKTFFLGLYILFKMFLARYYDVGYCSNVPKQRRRFLRLCQSLVDTNGFLIEKKDRYRVKLKEAPWGTEEMEYNNGTLEGTTVGTTPRGGHYNLAIGDDPLRDDMKYTHEFIVNYFQGVFKPTILRKKGRYIIVGCVSPDTKIITENGIEEIGDQIDYNPEKKDLIDFKRKVYGKDGWDETSKFYVNGKTKTKKIILENGFELECSRIHPLWTCISPRRGVKDVIKKDCNWIKSSELKIGDKIAIKLGTNVFGKKATISNDKAYFYGLFIAEGCVDTKGRANRVTISNKDNYCVNFIKNKFGFISQDEVHHRKNSKELVEKMRNYGVSFERCHSKRIPKKLMLEPKDIQVAFLQGLYDGDGHCTISNGKVRIVLTSTSKKQQLDVQAILLNFGIVPSLHKAKHKAHYKSDGSHIKESISYSLTCSGINAINFMKEIGFRIERKNKNLDSIRYRNFNEKFGFIWKKVKKIEDSENYTVDFVIPKSHSFLTNGIVSHNTPQDPEDLFHTLMNSKLDKNNRPVGKIVLDKVSAAGFFCQIFPGILSHKRKEVLVPEIWCYEELLRERDRIGDIRFNREIMCQCISFRNSLIGASLFRSCCDEKLMFLNKGEQDKRYIAVVDSATSDAPTADYCAISVWEDDQKNNKFILRHLIHQKGFPITDPGGGTDDQTNALYKIKHDFNNPLFVIEKNNAGIALSQSFQAMCSKGEESVNIIEHFTHNISTGRPTDKPGKANDIIDYIEKGIKAGVVVFPANHDDIYTIDSLEKVKIEHLNFGVKQGKSGEKYEAIAGKDDIFDTCFTGENLVKTNKGYKEIKNIEQGDYVLTHLNRYKKVIRVGKRFINEKIVEFNISGIPDKIRCTKEHPFLVTQYQNIHHSKFSKSRKDYFDKSFKWVEAGNIKLKSTRGNKYFMDLMIVPKKKFTNKTPFNDLNGFERFVGLYLAEGSCSHHGIALAFNKKEEELIDFCLDFLKRNGFNANTQVVGNCCRVYSQRMILKNYFKEFGKSVNKCLPPELIDKVGLLTVLGWLEGDGHFDRKGTIVTSISRSLVYQMKDILFRNKIVCNTHLRKRGWNTFPNSKPIYALILNRVNSKILFGIFVKNSHNTGVVYHNNHFMSSFKTKELSFQGYVYNLKVEGDESYTVNGVKVHNCWMGFKHRGDMVDTIPLAVTLPGI